MRHLHQKELIFFAMRQSGVLNHYTIVNHQNIMEGSLEDYQANCKSAVDIDSKAQGVPISGALTYTVLCRMSILRTSNITLSNLKIRL